VFLSRFSHSKYRRVLIASSHALFGQGLRSLLNARKEASVEVVGIVSNLDEALSALEKLNPDLIIVDYDDQILNRDEFLARFVEGEKKLRVVLLSLQSNREAIVYDRRTLAAAQIDDWLEEWSISDESTKPNRRIKFPKMENKIRRSNMKHFIVATMLVILVTALLLFGLNHIQLLPIQASAQAKTIDNLFRLEFMVIAFLFSLIVVFMIYSIIFFRKKKNDTTDAIHVEGNPKIEVAWTIAPLITVLFFAYLGGQSLAETLRADPKPLQIKVIGQQWSWRFEYPEYGIVSNTLMMPANKQALLKLSSEDVIHSFWVPEFRVKQDALPGGDKFVRELRVTPTRRGEFILRCAELCGRLHTTMQSTVMVVSQTDFEAWVTKESGLSEDPVERGKKWSENYGCVSCHSVDGRQLVGPSWKDLYCKQATFTDGTSTIANETYISESILNPGAKIVQGFQNVMPPNFAQLLKDQQVNDLVAYIKTLSSATCP